MKLYIQQVHLDTFINNRMVWYAQEVRSFLDAAVLGSLHDQFRCISGDHRDCMHASFNRQFNIGNAQSLVCDRLSMS